MSYTRRLLAASSAVVANIGVLANSIWLRQGESVQFCSTGEQNKFHPKDPQFDEQV